SSSNLFGEKRVTVVVSNTEDGQVKLSTRGTEYLVAKGLNLGRILQELCEQYGGNGGGHTIAAGATVDLAVLDKYLQEFSNRVQAIAAG
ncbi:MAG TPA: DHH family phosphoesterase, partial [Candidatus Binatus sp.]|nr:DHH family phosphoesterase [Candidatus Binatus sp.]